MIRIEGSYRVVRGGSWNDNGRYCSVSRRDDDNPYSRDYYLGFRVSRRHK
jgi:formylglycine-generating enzyme required for sulfatase activity